MVTEMKIEIKITSDNGKVRTKSWSWAGGFTSDALAFVERCKAWIFVAIEK